MLIQISIKLEMNSWDLNSNFELLDLVCILVTGLNRLEPGFKIVFMSLW